LPTRKTHELSHPAEVAPEQTFELWLYGKSEMRKLTDPA
jgi:hypothetical protein